MFSFAILIGIYSYLIFSIGLIGVLYKQNIIILSAIFLFIVIYFYKKFFLINLKKIKGRNIKLFLNEIFSQKIFLVFYFLFISQAAVNLIGALGPELSFDALWYHLTLPKIYLVNNAIFHVPGGLFYYSDMPKLAEMLYIAALSFHGELFAKLIQFSFGILSSIAIYKLSRKFFSQSTSFLAVLVFYSNLVVAWESGVSYTDLLRTFFEVMSLLGFINWIKSQDKKWLVESAILLGLAMSTKLLAVGSLLIFTILIIFYSLKKKGATVRLTTTNILIYLCISILVPMPWFIFSFINTGSPVYPFFTGTYPLNFDLNLFSPVKFIGDTWNILTHSPDPLSPLYIIFLPFIILFIKKIKNINPIVLYAFLAFIIWYITPRTGGGRFILPYLPAFSIIVACLASIFIEMRKFKYITLSLIIFVSLLSIVYRGAANAKYASVIIGKQTKSDFLSKNLNFSYGDFYDTDGYFKRNIEKTDKVLLYGFHNLYYVDFPFIDSSLVKKGDKFNYIAVQNSQLPERFKYWNLIYKNEKTNVRLYSLERQLWVY